VQDAAARTREAPVTQVSEKPSTELGAIKAQVDQILARDIELSFDGRSVSMSYADLGLAFDETSASRAQIDDGKLAGFVPIVIDRASAEKAVRALKASYDRSPVNARMDLEARKVHEATDGWGLDVFGSISAIEAAARRGADKIALEGATIPAAVRTADLGIADISTVLSSFTTKFSVGEKARNANLKLLATHLDGYVLKPGEVFKFNDITGDRTEKEGYKMAHVILAGEMVDGMAGGSCQISTTLHGAAFFAGLDIVDTTPHSRPSTYVQMGLDATVVYGQIDLHLRNPYDFPVAIHYKVARGEATVEILGKERPC
jgi:vancomycin resistance protein YoaR